MKKRTNVTEQMYDFLAARPGKPILPEQVGKQFGMTAAGVRQTLEQLVTAQRVRVTVMQRRRNYFVPSATQITALQRLQERTHFRPYVMPSALRDRVAEIRAHRAMFPSHYAGASM